VADGQIDYEATANDPGTWTRPSTFQIARRRARESAVGRHGITRAPKEDRCVDWQLW
jgi:hypothetical protein